MEPLTDYELKQVLKSWVAPNAPRSLVQVFSQPRPRWWERFLDPLGKRRRFKRLRKAKRYDTF